LQFNPQAGHEQAGHRCAIVLSPRAYNQRANLCVLCPITTQSKGYPFEVPIPPGHPVVGVVLSDQVKSLSWTARQAEFKCHAPPGVLGQVRGKVKALLKLP
jgi:mRNA interferase MazF